MLPLPVNRKGAAKGPLAWILGGWSAYSTQTQPFMAGW
jgi:hypothetical protein